MEDPVFSGVFERASTSVGGSILAARLAPKGASSFIRPAVRITAAGRGRADFAISMIPSSQGWRS
jgi:hypothetical protein